MKELYEATFAEPYLRAGQVVELGIAGLGTQRQVMGQA